MLDLKRRPRGSGSAKTNYTDYRFDDGGERRLTDWMKTNLQVAAVPVADPAAVEPELIALAWPPLNLTGWDNPDRSTIRAAKKDCADSAREQYLR